MEIENELAGKTTPGDLMGVEPGEKLEQPLGPGAQLGNADLAGRDLSGLDLSGANLEGADLSGAQLFRTRLAGANLERANLEGAELLGADLSGADLEGARLVRAGLGAAVMTGANLFGADLTEAALNDANFERADLRTACLDRARMAGARLESVKAAHANFSGADLSGVLVSNADLEGADLRSARLSSVLGYISANWIGVDLRDADFTGGRLVERHIRDENYIEEFRRSSRQARVVHWFWAVTSDCGRSILRWGLTTGVVVLAFAFLYTVVASDFGEHSTRLSPLYFSLVTMTTLGYGDVLPVSAWAQLVSMCQVVIGYVMLGGMLSIFSNRMARRSD